MSRKKKHLKAGCYDKVTNPGNFDLKTSCRRNLLVCSTSLVGFFYALIAVNILFVAHSCSLVTCNC